MNITMKAFVLGLAVIAAPAFAEAPRLTTYAVQWKGIQLGEGHYTLTPQKGKDCYRFESKTEPIAMVRWLYGTPYEVVDYCVKDGVVRPTHFEYRIDKREKDNFTLDFNWETRKVKALHNGVLREADLPETAYDRFSMQQAIRIWARTHAKDAKWEPKIFNLVDDDANIKPYRFEIKGRETVKTPAGEFTALRVERTDNPNKSLRSWLIPEQDFEPAVIENIKDGKVELHMELQ